MIATGRVDPKRLRTLFEQVRPDLYRYPAIDPAALDAAIDRALGS